MHKRKLLIGLALVLVGGFAWFLFRPELLFINATVHEEFPADAGRKASPTGTGPIVLVKGSFHSVAHQSKGLATIHRFSAGERVLRFTDFETSNGPALRVYLVAAEDAQDNQTVKDAGFVDLGPLKGNQGEQNYDVPVEVDLAKYQSVTIWCQRFSVNFATAPLTAQTN
jgi:hypothetical protein